MIGMSQTGIPESVMVMRYALGVADGLVVLDAQRAEEDFLDEVRDVIEGALSQLAQEEAAELFAMGSLDCCDEALPAGGDHGTTPD